MTNLMATRKANLRVKEQRSLQKCEITKYDCEEFIRIVKKYCDSFNKSDLIKYCTNNDIPLNKETLCCMFDEISLNSKNKLNEINSVDLFCLISKKRKRSFYIPLVFFIGKPNYIHAYENKLKKDKDVYKKRKHEEKQKLKKETEKNLKLKKEIKRYISYDDIFNIDNESKHILETHIEQCNNNIEKEKQSHLPAKDEGNILKKEKENDEAEKKIDENLDYVKECVEKKKNEECASVSKRNKRESNNYNENNSEKLLKDEEKDKKKNKNKDKDKSKKKNKKSTENKTNRKSENGEKEEIEKMNEEEEQNKILNLLKEEKKKKYHFLLQKVLNNKPKMEKKKSFLKSFHLVTYFKLNELIYISFLINKFYDYFYSKELDELTQTYERVLNQHKKDKDTEGKNRNNNHIEINLLDVVKRYEDEREKKKKNIYNSDSNKYLNSDVLTNFDFIKENINNIINPILSNLNIFFNYNIHDVEEIIKKYNFVVNDICELQKVETKNKLEEEKREENEGDTNKEDNEENEVDTNKEDNEENEGDTNKKDNKENKNKEEKEGDKNEERKEYKNKERSKNGIIYKKEKKTDINQEEKDPNDIPNILKALKKKQKDPIDKQLKKSSSCIHVNSIWQNYSKNSLNSSSEKTLLTSLEETALQTSLETILQTSSETVLQMPLKTTLENPSEEKCMTSVFADSDFEERDFESDTNIPYLEDKYNKEEIENFKNRNIPFELTNDINKIRIYKKTYFHDFFFLYMFRKLFWNIFALYNLYLTESSSKKRETKEQVDSSENENLVLYESDVSVNNLKNDKSMLYNTNELLSENLATLFHVIKNEKLLIYLRYDKNKKIKNKNKTEYIYRDIWIYLILTALNKSKKSKLSNFTFNQFIFFKENLTENTS